MRNSLRRLVYLFPWAALVAPLLCLARTGGGQHYSGGGGHSSSGGGHGAGGGGGGGGELIFDLIFLCVRYPQFGIPAAGVCVLAYYWYQRNLSPTATTQKAFEMREAELRTQVTLTDVRGWENALRLKDPSFEMSATLDKLKTLFVKSQDAWAKGDLDPIRPFISDAVFQRFRVQLGLMRSQGIKDAIADVEVLDAAPVGLDQSAYFDTLHVRIKAQMRDRDVPLGTPDGQAQALVKSAPLQSFIEVWSFVRRPGALTRIGQDLYQGKCPNCGAPFKGGASNNCEFCKAVVNSGNYDWTLGEITQGVEAVRGYSLVDGLLEARNADPALNLEMLEDRTSLIFWRWIEAESAGDATRLSKLARPECLALVEDDVRALKAQGKRRCYLDCAVGAVRVRQLRAAEGDHDEAHVEVRWSARSGMGPADEKPPASLPVVPERSMLVLTRRAGRLPTLRRGFRRRGVQAATRPCRIRLRLSATTAGRCSPMAMATGCSWASTATSPGTRAKTSATSG
jgi:hypothetical protein